MSLRLWALVLLVIAIVGGVAAGAVLLLSGEEAASRDELPSTWQRGMNVVAYTRDGYLSPESDASLRALRATGTTDVEIVTHWYQDDLKSTALAPDPELTPSDASLEHVIALARGLGFDVTLKPQIIVRDGEFRGDIAPTSGAEWFTAYRGMINHYAELAQRTGVTTLVIGVELTYMQRYPEEWTRVIREARERFSGRLTYAANWIDGAEKVAFWDQLDEIGIDAYMPVADVPNPTVEQIVQGWKPYVERIDRLRRRFDKPVTFTELGYTSRLGTAQRPYEQTNAPISQTAQANAYEAAFRVWSDVPWFSGIYWWDWPADSEGAPQRDGDYTPRGKLAEGVLRRWNGAPSPGSGSGS